MYAMMMLTSDVIDDHVQSHPLGAFALFTLHRPSRRMLTRHMGDQASVNTNWAPNCLSNMQARRCNPPGNGDDVHRWLTAALPAKMGRALAADVVQGGREVCVCGRHAQACVACAVC